MSRKLYCGLLFAFFCILQAAFADAPETRAGILIALQEAKAKALHPYKPNAVEEWVVKVEGWGLLSPVARGLYPYFGSAYPGGGFALGGGYRLNYGDNGFADLHGAWSVYNYRMLDGTLKLPDAAGGHLQSAVNAHYVDANKIAYFGIGNDTTTDDESAYSFSPSVSATLNESFLLSRAVSLNASVSYRLFDLAPGELSGVPSIETIYTPETAPGLGTDPEYVVWGAVAQADWRQSPGYTTRGGFYQAAWFEYISQNGLQQDFTRLDVEGRQFIPILRANQVIALRALASFTQVQGDNEIPFFLLPKLGGGDELRGFTDYRFRDRYRMLLTAEYRWTPSKFLDMVVYYETGKVAARSEDLDFNDLHDTIGFGARFHTLTATPLRIELAHSEEGLRLIFSGGTAF